MPRPLAERRLSPRYLCSHMLEIRRSGPDGTASLDAALLEDLSAGGAGVAVGNAVEAGEPVELVAPGLHVKAEVRYCLRRETDFRLGLEFTDGYTWRPEDWEPDHLFLPPPID